MEIIWIALFYVLFIQALIIITFPIPYFFIGLALALCVVGGLVFLHQFQLLL